MDDNTIVVFTTDNGTETFTWPDGGGTPFKGQKGTIYKGGLRVPAMVRWPGNLPAGSIGNGIISGLDWLPTFVAAAGNANLTDELLKGKKIGDVTYTDHLDGYNQLDMITGKGPSAGHDLQLRRKHAGRSAHRATNIASSNSRMAGSAKRSMSMGQPLTTSDLIRLNVLVSPLMALWMERKVSSISGICMSSGVLFSSSWKWANCHDGNRLSADAEGRGLRPRCSQGADRTSGEAARGTVSACLRWAARNGRPSETRRTAVEAGTTSALSLLGLSTLSKNPAISPQGKSWGVQSADAMTPRNGLSGGCRPTYPSSRRHL